MKIKLHHVNLCSTDVPALDAFYRDVLDMKTEPGLSDNRTPGGGYPGKVSFVTDGTTQFHLSEKDMGVNFRTGQAMSGSPISYEVNGQQYVAVASGNLLFSFALPEKQ